MKAIWRTRTDLRLRRMLLVLAVALAGLRGTGATGQSNGTPSTQGSSVKIIVSNLGINQSKAGLKMFDDFHQLDNKALFPLPNSAQILVPMPFDSQKISGLPRQIMTALAAGNSTVEIRFVEDMGLAGYVAKDVGLTSGQEAINQSFSEVLKAVNSITQDVPAMVVGVFGSHGTETAAQTIPDLNRMGNNPIGSVVLVDGTATKQETLGLSSALNGKVSIINTYMDVGLYKGVASSAVQSATGISLGSADTISEPRVAQAVNQADPRVPVYYAEPTEPSPTLLSHNGLLKGGSWLISQFSDGRYGPSQPYTMTTPMVGDPEWVPVLPVPLIPGIAERFVGAQPLGIPQAQATQAQPDLSGNSSNSDPGIFGIAPTHPEIVDPSSSLPRLRQTLQDLKQQLNSSGQDLQQAQNELQLEEQKDRAAQSSAQGFAVQITIPIPPGWVPCECPDQHPNAGIFVNGVQYHTPFLHCR